MDNLIPITILILIIFIIILYLHILNFKDNFIDVENDLFYAKFARKINKYNYQKYIKEKQDALQGTNFKFGFSPINSTNKQSIGICPLGKYYSGKFDENPLLNSKKCKPCFNCQKEEGYYVAGGCLGNTDSICKFGKVPHKIFTKSHKSRSLLHSQLPLHHRHQLYKGKDEMKKEIFFPSASIHTHI